MNRASHTALFALILAALVTTCGHPKDIGKLGRDSNRFVYSVEIKGAISPSTMETLVNAVEKAENDNARALIVRLNTPGGLSISMDEMCQKILNARIPVITYVWPHGAYAGSAGVYIMYASHLAAMSPATNIGSATPVMMGGGGETEPAKGSDRIPAQAGADDAKNMKRKIFNHARAQIRTLAQFHKRNADFGERTVTHAANITSQEALRIGAIEIIADDLDDLLKKSQDRQIHMVAGFQSLDLKGVEIRDIKTDFRSEFLAFLTNPVIVNLLMMIGVLGLLVEVQYPGAVFPGVVGAICLILGLYAMQTLPVNFAGLGLIILGVIFFILEIKIISYGLLSLAGIVCFLIGSILLVRSGDELLWKSLTMVVGTTLIVSGVMTFLVFKAVQVMKKKPVSGSEQLLTETGTAYSEVSDSKGQVFIHSEIWSARAARPGMIIEKGTPVRVADRQHMLLYVEPDVHDAGTPGPDSETAYGDAKT